MLKIEIERDALFVTDRLREIDETYYVLYDFKTLCYELHSSGQKPTFCLKFPFEALDERCVIHAKKTRAERREELFKELNLENEKLEKSKVKGMLSSIDNFMREVL